MEMARVRAIFGPHQSRPSSQSSIIDYPPINILNMPSKPKSKATKPINPTSTSPSEPKPFARKDYYSSLAYHLALLFGSFLLLPRTRSSYVSRWGIASASPDDNTGWHQTTSADRPEHPWLTPITANPTRTLLWHLMGEVVIVLMWGQHLVSLSGVKRVVDKQQRVAANMSVSLPCLSYHKGSANGSGCQALGLDVVRSERADR